jgi:hypothetical protein
MNHRDFLRRNHEVVLATARTAARQMEWGFTEPAHAGRGQLCADCDFFTPPEQCGSHLGECNAPQGSEGAEFSAATADVEPACHRFVPLSELVRR